MVNPHVRPTTIKMDQHMKERIKRLAKSRRHSSHWIMLEAIQQYIDREEKREAFRQDAIKAWDAYQHTGLHVTLEEANVWLDSLSAGEDIEPPICHD